MKSLSKLKVVKRLSVEEQKMICGGFPTVCYKYEYSSGLVRESNSFDSMQQGLTWCNTFSDYACCCNVNGHNCYDRW